MKEVLTSTEVRDLAQLAAVQAEEAKRNLVKRIEKDGHAFRGVYEAYAYWEMLAQKLKRF